jgi:hypothetical protein
VGGQVDFERVPEGPWIVRRWTIRMPRLGLRTSYQPGGAALNEPFVAGLKEAGGEILDVRLADGSALVEEAPGATLTGTVFDSVSGGALPGATVRLAGTEFSATADSRGRFRMDSLPAGSFDVVFEADRLDELPWTPAAVPVELRAGDAATVTLGIPPLERVLSEGCQVTVEGPGTGVLVGRATVAAAGAVALAGTQVAVTWQDNNLLRNPDGSVRVVQENASARTALGAGGRFSVCGLPDGVMLTIRAEWDEAAGPPVKLELTRGEMRRVDLAVPVGG